MALERLGLLWLIVYNAAWLAGARLWWQAAMVLALLPIAAVSLVLRPWPDVIGPLEYQRAAAKRSRDAATSG